MFKSKSQEYIEVKLSPQFCNDTKDNQLKHLVNCFADICMTFRLMPYDVFLSVFYPEELQNPLAVNTDNKTADSVGVVTSEGEALFNKESDNSLVFNEFELEILLILVNTEIDLNKKNQNIFKLSDLKSIKKKLLSIDTDIPQSFKNWGV